MLNLLVAGEFSRPMERGKHLCMHLEVVLLCISGMSKNPSILLQMSGRK